MNRICALRNFPLAAAMICLLAGHATAALEDLAGKAAGERNPAARKQALDAYFDALNDPGKLTAEEQVKAAWYGYFLADDDASRLRVVEIAGKIPSPDARMILFGLTDSAGIEKPVAAAQKALDAQLAAWPGAKLDKAGRVNLGMNPFDQMAAFERFVAPPPWVGRWGGGGVELDVNAFPAGTIAGRLRWKEGNAAKEVRVIGFDGPDGLRIVGPGWTAVWKDGRFQASGPVRQATLERMAVGRTGTPPPQGAKILFDGSNLQEWTDKNGGPAAWKITPEGWMEIPPGVGDHRTKDSFGNVRLYLEYRHAFNPDGINRKRGNSGVYLQSNYEIQLNDNFANDVNEALSGAIYHVATPKVNASAPPMEWQSLEVEFFTPQVDSSGKKTAHARMTVWQNGVMIHENVELPQITGGGKGETADPLPVNLQAHGGLLQFRNIWAQPLPQRGIVTP